MPQSARALLSKTYTRPVQSVNSCVISTETMLTLMLIEVMEKASITPMLLMKIVPYTEMKFWPVPWRKTFTPMTIRVRLRFAVLLR